MDVTIDIHYTVYKHTAVFISHEIFYIEPKLVLNISALVLTRDRTSVGIKYFSIEKIPEVAHGKKFHMS